MSMAEWGLFAVALFLVGACVGSFLNVVVYRLPAGMSLLSPPSRCPRCEHPIRWRDNVPVLGWLWLRGRCRDCGAAISARYPLVEALSGLMLLAIGVGACASGASEIGRLAEPVQGPPGWISSTFIDGTIVLSLLSAGLIAADGKRVPARLFIPAAICAVWGAGRQHGAIASDPVQFLFTSLMALVVVGIGYLLAQVWRRRAQHSEPLGAELGLAFLAWGPVGTGVLALAAMLLAVVLTLGRRKARPLSLFLAPLASVFLLVSGLLARGQG